MRRRSLVHLSARHRVTVLLVAALVATSAAALAGNDKLSIAGGWGNAVVGADWLKPRAPVGAAPATVAAFEYQRTRGQAAGCQCSNQHRIVSLGGSYPCDRSWLTFKLYRDGDAGHESREQSSIEFGFCKNGTCGFVQSDPTPGTYDALIVGEGGAPSACWGFDRATLSPSHDVMRIRAAGEGGAGGGCTNDFDEIDVHVQLSICDGTAQGAIELSDLAVEVGPDPGPSRKPPGGPNLEDTVFPAGHLRYGIGGALGPARSSPGFRQGLDAAAGVSFGGRAVDPTWTMTGSVVTGFGAYPTYASVELGKLLCVAGGTLNCIAGLQPTLGPTLRLGPTFGAGGEASAFAWLFYFAQVGVRTIFIVTDRPEVQIEGTLGVGLF